MKKIFLSLLFILTLSSGVLAKGMFWDNIDVDMFVNTDSSVNIEEKQTYVFDGDWNGGYRDLDIKGIDEVKNIEVWEGDRKYTEGSLQKYCFNTEVSPYHRLIRWRSRDYSDPPYNNEQKIFTVKYKATGLIKHDGNRDLLFWPAIFADRQDIVRHARINVHFPVDISHSRIDLSVSPSASNIAGSRVDSFTFTCSGDNILPKNSFDVYVYIPPGLVRITTPKLIELTNYCAPAMSLLIVIGTFIIMLFIQLRLGPEPRVSDITSPVTSPPSDLSPAIAGTVIDSKAGPKEIVATIIDLAVRGYIRITSKTNKVLLLSFTDHTLELLKAPDGLADYEVELIKKIFDGTLPGLTKDISDLKNNFSASVKSITDMIYAAASKQGFFAQDPNKIRTKYQTLAGLIFFGGLFYLRVNFLNLPMTVVNIFLIFFVILMVIYLLFLENLEALPVMLFMVFILYGIPNALNMLNIFSPENMDNFMFYLALGVIFSSAVIALFSFFMPRWTVPGMKEKKKWESFRDFLSSDDTNLSQPGDVFDKYLPYAIALGVDKGWVKKFAALGSVAGVWYVGYSGGQIGSAQDGFTGFGGGASGGAGAGRDVSGMIGDISSSISAGSSGLGGGGSSGGGGGGGGW